MTNIDFVPILVMGLVIYTLTNFVKYLTNRDWNAAITLMAGWIIGVAAVWLVGASSWGHSIAVGGSQTLDHLSFVEKLLVGLIVVSTGSTVFDLKKAFDRSDTAAAPALVPGLVPTPAPLASVEDVQAEHAGLVSLPQPETLPLRAPV